MTLGEKLKELREQRGWSQHELSRRAHVRQALISVLETGKQTDTTGSVLRRLARTLGVTMDYLGGMYNGTVDPNQSPGGEASLDGLALPLVTTSPERKVAVKSIPSEAQRSPQDLVNPYPCVQLHHWFAMVQAPLARMKMFMEGCCGPTSVSEEMRQIYLDVLRDCEQLLHISLSPAMREQLAREEAQLNAAIHAQRTRKVGVRRKAALAQMAVD
jgi:transcriptional regulator with XRE-family HTH domain